MTIILALAVALAVTFSVKKNIPADFFSLNGFIKAVSMPIVSLENRLVFNIGERKSIFSVAAVVEALDPKKTKSFTAPPAGVAREVPILLYHGITPKADRFSMTEKTFKDQLFALKKAGYHTISLNDLYAFLNGNKVLDDKSFLITFDDGRSDSYYGADPVLSALDFTAVMFVATADSLESPDQAHSYYLHAPLLKLMAASGRWEIGSHAIQEDTTGGFVPIDASGSLGNFLSNKKWLKSQGRLETDAEYKSRIENELVGSKMELEKYLGIKTRALAFPFGDYGQQTINYPNAVSVIDQILRPEYDMAFQQVWSYDNFHTSNYPGDNLYHLHRVEVDTSWTGDQLVGFLQNSAHSKSLPYVDSLVQNDGWKHSWGTVYVANSTILMQSSPVTTGAFAFLDGTADWKNYFYTASANREKGSYISLIARYKDKDNYVSCAFSDDRVRILEKVDGVEYTLKNIPNTLILPEKQVSFGISVSGSSLQCYEGSDVVNYSYNVDKKLDQGGIALQVWDPMIDKASATFSSLKAVMSKEDSVALKKSLPQYLSKEQS